jgi:hypothetical protein
MVTRSARNRCPKTPYTCRATTASGVLWPIGYRVLIGLSPGNSTKGNGLRIRVVRRRGWHRQKPRHRIGSCDGAGALFLSVNTVKTHLRSAYRKLGVGSRREAIARGRWLGLL